MSPKPETLLVLQNPTKANPLGKISATADSCFWSKEMTHDNLGDAINIFRERAGKPENKSREQNSIKVPDEKLGDNAQCQGCVAVHLVDPKSENEKLREKEEKQPSVQILRGQTEISISKVRFAKARSFPMADSTGTGSFRLATRKHKESEFWPFTANGKKLVEDSDVTSSSLVKNDGRPDRAAKTKGLVPKLHLCGWDRLIVKRFNFIKQRLKRVFSLRKSRPQGAFLNSSLGRVSRHKDINRENDGSSKTTGIESSPGYRASDFKLEQRSRTCSLSESVEKYDQLLGNTCSTNAKFDHSRSLRLRSAEGVICSSKRGMKIFRRWLSLPDLDVDSLHPLLGEMERLSVNTESIHHNKLNPKFDIVKVHKNKGSHTVEMGEGSTDSHPNSPEDLVHLTTKGAVPDNEAESTFESEISIALQQVANIELPWLDSNERSMTSSHFEGAVFSARNCFGSSEEVKIMNGNDNMVKLVRSYYKMDKKAEVDFNFVRDLLELSGLFEVKGNCTMWLLTSHRRLKRSLLNDLEVLSLYNLDSCDRELLFDLVSESLVEICSRSSACKWKASLKEKHEILEEVWKRVYWYQSLGSDVDRSLEDIVVQDMKGGYDIWTNIGVEMEDVGSELEDFIFDKLIDEFLEFF